MNADNNIEDIFKDTFGAWEPQVPQELHKKIEGHLFKKKGFALWRLGVAFLLLLLGVGLTLFFVGERDGLHKKQSASESVHEHASLEHMNSNESQQHVASDKHVGNSKTESVARTQATSGVVSNEKVVKSNKGRGSVDPSSKSKATNISSKTNYRVQENAKSRPEKVEHEQAKSNPIERMAPQESPAEEIANASAVQEQKLRESETSILFSSDKLETSETHATKGLPKDQASSGTNHTVSDTTHAISQNDLGTEAIKSGVLLGLHLGSATGFNKFPNGINGFYESKNYVAGLDVQYEFITRHRLSSGIYYQQRQEQMDLETSFADSTFLYTEPIIETYIDPATNQLVTVIVGYQDVYQYDTNFIVSSESAQIRLAMIPLRYDLALIRYRNHVLWLGLGTQLGWYQFAPNGLNFNSGDTQNKFSAQLVLRPSYLISFGAFELGVFGQYSWDALLPNPWPSQRKRSQFAFGVQGLFRF